MPFGLNAFETFEKVAQLGYGVQLTFMTEQVRPSSPAYALPRRDLLLLPPGCFVASRHRPHRPDRPSAPPPLVPHI